MTRNKAPKEPFFKIWDKDPEGKAKDISKFNYLRHAATALPAAVNLRGVKKQQLMAAGAFAAAHFAQRVVTDQKNISRMRAILREESRPAPKNVQLTAEPAEQNKLYGEAQKILAEDVPALYLFVMPKLGVWDKKLKGLWKNEPIPSNVLTNVSWEE